MLEIVYSAARSSIAQAQAAPSQMANKKCCQKPRRGQMEREVEEAFGEEDCQGRAARRCPILKDDPSSNATGDPCCQDSELIGCLKKVTVRVLPEGPSRCKGAKSGTSEACAAGSGLPNLESGTGGCHPCWLEEERQAASDDSSAQGGPEAWREEQTESTEADCDAALAQENEP